VARAAWHDPGSRFGRRAVATTSISLPDDQLARLRLLALMQRRPLDEVIREAIDAYLAQLPDLPTTRVTEPTNDLPDAEWQARWDAVAERIRQAGPTQLTPEELEREITLAREEARREMSID
jgi:predicted DNA-binding protein